MGMDNEKAHMSEQIQELTLLLMYLTSWLNDPTQFEQVDETCGLSRGILCLKSLDVTAFLRIDAPWKI